MTSFTPVSATLGGALIGLSALLTFLLLGRVAGISSILGNLLRENHPDSTPATGRNDRLWRLAFCAGLAIAPALYAGLAGSLPPLTVTSSTPVLVVGGLLVGFGTRLAGGCTSGHGVCGLARLSTRSILATAVFMAAGALTVVVARHWL